MKEKKKFSGTIIYLIMLLIGGGLLLYPSISNYWNSHHSAQIIAGYQQKVQAMNDNEYESMFADAENYNRQLQQRTSFTLSDEELNAYNSLLSFDDDGLMGKIEIPDIDVVLPIYHGCDDDVLQSGVGHIEWSSLPVGGEGTHCVISGHRGLPSAKLFTNLDELQPGDIFIISVLDRDITYEVDSIYTVLPEDLSYLTIREGEDLCTLVTCTPYGINTHRLLVQGHRIDNLLGIKSSHIMADAIQIEPVIVAPILAIPMLAVMFILQSIFDKKEKYYEGDITL